MHTVINSSRGKVSSFGKLSPPYVCPNYHDSGWKYLPI